MLPNWLEECLICPDCGSQLGNSGRAYVCGTCEREFATESGVVRLLPTRTDSPHLQDGHFDQVAHVYDDAIPQHVRDHYLSKRVNLLKSVVKRGRLLDVGCGTGLLIEELAENGFEVAGVDISPAMLEVMRSRVALPALCAQSTRLPFLDNTFDTVLCVAMLHHVSVKEAVSETIHEMIRVAKSGGLIMIIDHNPLNPYWPLLMRRMPQDDGTERLIPLTEILSSVSSSGAELFNVHQLGFIPDFLPQRILPFGRWVELLLESSPLIRKIAAHNIVVARKL